jgi:hypothetical protein
MIDDVVKACCEAIGINLHGRKLGAQCRQAFTETLSEVLEAGALKMRYSPCDRSTTEPERDGGCPQIKQGQHNLQHGLKARPVVRELELRGYFTVF